MGGGSSDAQWRSQDARGDLVCWLLPEEVRAAGTAQSGLLHTMRTIARLAPQLQKQGYVRAWAEAGGHAHVHVCMHGQKQEDMHMCTQAYMQHQHII